MQEDAASLPIVDSHDTVPASSRESEIFPQYPEPTSVPTPERPLLRDGRLLVMPPTWDGCDECHGTGFRLCIPSLPHEACWSSYGRAYTPALPTSREVVEGAMILQRPLPRDIPGDDLIGPSLASSAAPRVSEGNASSEPEASMATHTGGFAPPSGPPPPPRRNASHGSQQSNLRPPSSSRRRSPPRVNRAEDSSEASTDVNGEAPPAYEDVVRTPHGVSLPPQRPGGGTHSHGPTPGINGHMHQSGQWGPTTSGGHHRPPSGPPPPPLHHNSHSTGYPGTPFHHRPLHQAGPPAPFGAYGGMIGSGPSGSLPPQSSAFQHPGHFGAAPGAFGQSQGPLVVRPGDIRIGGRLCYKCGGSGLRESLWWGDETCNGCGGIGRML
ncbi:unnamed protein product [Parajaminaea phylloscopi]